MIYRTFTPAGGPCWVIDDCRGLANAPIHPSTIEHIRLWAMHHPSFQCHITHEKERCEPIVEAHNAVRECQEWIDKKWVDQEWMEQDVPF